MKFWRVLLGLVIFFFLGAEKTLAMGLGLCHWVGYAQYTDWGYDGGVGTSWGTLQPTNSLDQNAWNWDEIEHDISFARANSQKIWIQILTASVGNLAAPQWAQTAGVEVIDDGEYPGFGYYQTRMSSVATIWDPEYLYYYDRALQVLAERYNDNPQVEAVIINGGGGYGEMAMQPRICYGEANADVTNPSHPLVVSLANAWGINPEELTAPNCTCLGYSCPCFDYYYIKSVNRLIDIYMTRFTHKPAVLQLGTGLSCMGWVPAEVVRYANCKYGNRVWTKFNGWGPGETTLSGDSKYSYTGFEPGGGIAKNKTWWKNYGSGLTEADRIEQGRIFWQGYVKETIYDQNPAYFCLQGIFFENPSEYYFGLNDCCGTPNDCVGSGIASGFCIRELKTHLAEAPAPVPISRDDCQALITPGPEPSPNLTPRPTQPPSTITPSPTPTNPPTTPSSCTCSRVQLYNTDNTPLDVSQVRPGQTVRIFIIGRGEKQWSARVRVNGGSWTETESWIPPIGYYFDWTVPSSGGTFNIEGEINCSGIWVGATGCRQTLTVGIPGDFIQDGKVNIADLIYLLSNWGTPAADLSQDETTDEADLSVLLSNWKP